MISNKLYTSLADLLVPYHKIEMKRKFRLFQIPDLTPIIDDVDNLLSNDTVSNIQKGKTAFENIRKELNATISKSIPTVTDTLIEAGE